VEGGWPEDPGRGNLAWDVTGGEQQGGHGVVGVSGGGEGGWWAGWWQCLARHMGCWVGVLCGEFGRRASRAKEVAGWVMGAVYWGRGVAGRVRVGHEQCPAQLGALGKWASRRPVKILCRGRARDRE